MGDALELRKSEKPCCSLDGMQRAKNSGQGFMVAGFLFQPDEVGIRPNAPRSIAQPTSTIRRNRSRVRNDCFGSRGGRAIKSGSFGSKVKVIPRNTAVVMLIHRICTGKIGRVTPCITESATVTPPVSRLSSSGCFFLKPLRVGSPMLVGWPSGWTICSSVVPGPVRPRASSAIRMPLFPQPQQTASRPDSLRVP